MTFFNYILIGQEAYYNSV